MGSAAPVAVAIPVAPADVREMTAPLSCLKYTVVAEHWKFGGTPPSGIEMALFRNGRPFMSNTWARWVHFWSRKTGTFPPTVAMDMAAVKVLRAIRTSLCGLRGPLRF